MITDLTQEIGGIKQMEASKLMTPLFYNGNFNREGRRMRAILEKEISDGKQTYRLWRAAGKPDLDYPRADNDKYLLYAEINSHLAPLGRTDYDLTDVCGFEPAAQKMYGGKEKRGTWIDALRESGGNDAVIAGVAEERKVIEQYGGDPIRQTAYIRSLLDDHVSTYLKSKENGGQTFPDFTGALVMNELTMCSELSAVYQEKQRAEAEAHQAIIDAEDKAYCEEQNRIAEQTVSAAIQVIREGGILKNQAVMFYRSRYDSSTYSIFNYLMRQYQVDVPLRTQGWINERLSNVTIRDGKCESLLYLRHKNGQGSQKFFECMNALICAVTERTSGSAA